MEFVERRIDDIKDGRFDGTGFGRPPPPGEPFVDVDKGPPMPPPPQFEMERRGMPPPEGGGAATR